MKTINADIRAIGTIEIGKGHNQNEINISAEFILDDLKEIVKGQVTIDDFFDDKEIIGYVKDFLKPWEVFTTDQLHQWAVDNDYRR